MRTVFLGKGTRVWSWVLVVGLVGAARSVQGQDAPAVAPEQRPEHVPAPGKVLFSGEPAPVLAGSAGDKAPSVPVTDAERWSVTITARDIDLHVAAPRIEAQVTLTVKNSSAAPVKRIALQLSSALRWQSVAAGGRAMAFTQSPIATDADHTGYAQEAVITLGEPLAPDGAVTLTAFYAGELRQSGARLELLGTPADKAALVDWDQISGDPEATAAVALRGFGNVIWYPVAAPTALLGDANRLFEVIGEQRLREAGSTFRLRLTMEYTGEAPNAAVLNGRTVLLEKTNDTSDTLVAETHGVATAEFGARLLGFRSASLFVTNQPPKATDEQLMEVVSPLEEAVEPLAAAGVMVDPLVADWLGAVPITPLRVIDHPGQPFEDDALLVTPLDPNARAEEIAPQAVHGLAHASLESSHPWIDEGFAQFMTLLWLEQKNGRKDVVAELTHDATLIALAEPDLSAKAEGGVSSSSSSSSREDGSDAVGQPLIRASSEVFYRTKAAAVFWQLRDIVGEDTLKMAMKAYRKSVSLNANFDGDPRAFQTTLEKVAKRDLSWFFDDWVNRDRGLPDLTIVSVSPRPLPARPGKNDGYLVAVEVRNEGTAVAEVPVTVRSGTFTASERLRIPAGASVSTRIVFEGAPETVQVNDGTVPELRTTVHTRTVQVRAVQP